MSCPMGTPLKDVVHTLMRSHRDTKSKIKNTMSRPMGTPLQDDIHTLSRGRQGMYNYSENTVACRAAGAENFEMCDHQMHSGNRKPSLGGLHFQNFRRCAAALHC